VDTTQDKESLHYKLPVFGEFVCHVLFNEDRWDGELIPLGRGTPSEEAQANYLARGLKFMGVVGFLNGRLCSAWEHPVPENNVVEYLGRAYSEWIYANLVTAAPSKTAADDAVSWLRKLASLPDTRVQEN
jgi:hypothetical protein